MNKCICEDLIEGVDKEIEQGDWNTMYILKQGGEYYIKAISDGCVSLKINYCPICGRRLENES